MIARKAERKAARAAKPKLTAQERAAKSDASYMEHLHDAFRSNGQTRAELIDRWWERLTEEGRQRFYDDKIAPWLEARAAFEAKAAARAAKRPAEALDGTPAPPEGRADDPFANAIDLSPELWARVKAGELSLLEAAKLAEAER